jgi:hypothetical protein
VATLYCKAEGVLAGVPFFDEVFKQLDCRWGYNQESMISFLSYYVSLYCIGLNGRIKKAHTYHLKASWRLLKFTVKLARSCWVNELL